MGQVEVSNPQQCEDDGAAPARTEREFEFTLQDFESLRDILHERTGILLSHQKQDLVYLRLAVRLRALGLRSFAAYRSRVQSGDRLELEYLLDALTTHVTRFFREAHHFDLLRNEIAPSWRLARLRDPGARIWSAGCSTGQEPYSISMCIQELIPHAVQNDVKILATDVSGRALQRAARGIYTLAEVEDVPAALRARWFLRGTERGNALARVKPELAAPISFARLNLNERSWPMRGPFHAIFCRNVMIYFDRSTCLRLMARFLEILAPGGYLFLGHSEGLMPIDRSLERVGRTVYRKPPR